VQAVDIKQLLTETDSPFAAPNPNERNEPANVIFCIEKIAEIKGLSKDDVAEQIYKNFKKVFQLM
jgi:TatD DNase family protein